MTRHQGSADLYRGIMFMLMTQCFSATLVTMVKVASEHVSTLLIIFVSYLISLCVVTLRIFYQKTGRFKTAYGWLQLGRSVVGILYFGGLFLAVRYIPVVDGILLRSTAPAWVPLIMWVWVRERINPHMWWGIAIGFVGVVLVLNPTLVALNVGYLIALLSSVSYALSGVMTNRLNAVGEPWLRTLFYTFLIPCVACVPFAVAYWPAVWRPEDIVLLTLIGFGTVIVLFLYVSALRYASPTVLFPFTYVGVVIAAVYDWFLWDEGLSVLSLLGICCVFTGCFFIVRLQGRADRNSVPMA